MTARAAGGSSAPTISNVGNLGATHSISPTGVVWLVGTLNANCTVTVTPTAGTLVKLILTQDSTGGRSLTISDGTNTQAVTGLPTTAGTTVTVDVFSDNGTDLYYDTLSGEEGPAGPDGPTGSTGSQGIQGPTGPTGAYQQHPVYDGLLAQSMPRYMLYGGTQANIRPSAGRVFGIKVPILSDITVTKIVIPVNQAGVGLTAGQNFAGIYNSSGTRLGLTADQTTAWGSTSEFLEMSLTGSVDLTGSATGYVYVAILTNTGTSTVGLRCLNQSTNYNDGLTAATYWSARLGGLTGQTSLPSSVTLASNASENVFTWVGLK